LELFGSGYVIDHCISAYNLYTEEKIYRMYVTDVLRAGKDYPRWIDLVEQAYDRDENKETAEEIVSRLSERLDKLGGEEDVDAVRPDDQDRS